MLTGNHVISNLKSLVKLRSDFVCSPRDDKSYISFAPLINHDIFSISSMFFFTYKVPHSLTSSRSQSLMEPSQDPEQNLSGCTGSIIKFQIQPFLVLEGNTIRLSTLGRE